MHNLLIALGAALSCCAAAVLYSKDVTAAAATTPLVTTAETLVALGAALTVETTTCKCAVRGFATLTVGTSTTAVTARLYRGTTSAGTLIGSAIAQAGNFVAGSPAQFMVEATDPLTNAGVAQYCMTLQQTAASANGSCTTAIITTEVLSG
jgi:hypothetical protein